MNTTMTPKQLKHWQEKTLPKLVRPRITKKQTAEYFKMLDAVERLHDWNIRSIEQIMQHETGIEDIEFYRSEDGICGIGNASRTMKLVHR